MKLLTLTLATLVAGAVSVQAQQTSTTSSASTTAAPAADESTSTTLKKSDVVGEQGGLKDTDQEITNAKLRAESGSKKKYSFRSTFTYSGSSIVKPLDPIRPNFTGLSVNDTDTTFSGNLGFKYRATDRSNLSLRAGLQLRRPFGGDLPAGGSKLEIANPYVTYEYVQNAKGFQLISSTSVDAGTSRNRQEADRRSVLNMGQTLMYSFPNKIDFGGIIDLNVRFFGDRGDLSRTTYEFGLYPMLEYSFSPKYSFRTVFRYFTVESVSRSNPHAYNRPYGSQSVGIGISAARDLYFYPNIQFAPQNLRADTTNWGITTNINL